MISQLYEILRFLRLNRDVNNDFACPEEPTERINIIDKDNEAYQIATQISKIIAALVFSSAAAVNNKKIAHEGKRDYEPIKLKDRITIPDAIVLYSYLNYYEDLQKMAILTRLRVFAAMNGFEFDENEMIIRRT